MPDRGYPTCKTCEHYGPTRDWPELHPALGRCDSPKWRTAFHVDLDAIGEIPPDGVLVEYDEEVGMVAAAGFGCIHHAEREATSP